MHSNLRRRSVASVYVYQPANLCESKWAMSSIESDSRHTINAPNECTKIWCRKRISVKSI